MNELFYAAVFFLPAGFANMTPVLANKIPLLNRWKTPLDFGKNFRGRRLFGANKTWRGLVYGAVGGGLTGMLAYAICPAATERFDVTAAPFVVGAALGTGALVGDAVESFFKRQAGVKPGHSWFPFDQIDYILGGLLFALPFSQLDGRGIASIVVVYFGLHLVISYVGYLLRFKDKPI